MIKAELEKIKETERWPVKFSDFYKHYFFVIFPLVIFLIGLSMFYSVLMYDNTHLMIPASGITLVGLMLLFFIINRLVQNHTFEKYLINGVTVEEIKDALKKTGFNSPTYYKKGYFKCVTNISAFSWGEEVTIIPVENYVLINSRPNGQPITFFKDKKNINRFLTELKNSAANTTYSA